MADSGRDVVIVGGGVIGAAVAYYAADAGLSVALLDDRPLGSGCTFHGTGQVWKMIWNEPAQYRLAMEARDLLFDLVPVILEATGVDSQLHRYDTLMPIFNEEDAVRIERDLATSEGDIHLEWLERRAVLDLESRINPQVERGAYLRDSAQVDGYRLTQALAKGAAGRGADFLCLRAIGVEKQGGRVTAVVHSGGKIACGNVVIAMGASSAVASEWLGFPVPIKPLKGETVRVRPAAPFPMQIYRPSGGSASPRADGIVSLGATGTSRFSDMSSDLVAMQDDTTPTVEGSQHILSAARWTIPQLAEAEVVYHSAGPRPLSADGMPIIGPVPGLDGAYIATGHRNKGIHLAPLTGQIITDFIVDGTARTRTELDTFLPARFAEGPIEFNVAGVTSAGT